MIVLQQKKRGMRFPEYDYIVDKDNKLGETIQNLTPKFSGKWVVILIGSKLKFVQELLDSNATPEWIDLHIYLDAANLEKVLLEYPSMAPKKSMWKDDFNDIVARLTNLLSTDASKILYTSYRNKPEELTDVLQDLDKECTNGIITKKQVQAKVNIQKIVYASSVLDAFLLQQKNRWDLYNRLMHSVGMRIAYYAMYKYSKTLLVEKNKYLHNEDVKQRCVTQVDAMLIDYCYVLFVNSVYYKQLPVILYSIDNRSTECLERITNAYL